MTRRWMLAAATAALVLGLSPARAATTGQGLSLIRCLAAGGPVGNGLVNATFCFSDGGGVTIDTNSGAAPATFSLAGGCINIFDFSTNTFESGCSNGPPASFLMDPLLNIGSVAFTTPSQFSNYLLTASFSLAGTGNYVFGHNVSEFGFGDPATSMTIFAGGYAQISRNATVNAGGFITSNNPNAGGGLLGPGSSGGMFETAAAGGYGFTP